MISPYAKAVLSVIRLAGCGLIILSFGLCSSDVYLYLSHRPFSGPALLALKAGPALAGAALCWKAKPMAIHLTKDLD
jgi:hypothetical protein